MAAIVQIFHEVARLEHGIRTTIGDVVKSTIIRDCILKYIITTKNKWSEL